jgi:hypothetical protein
MKQRIHQERLQYEAGVVSIGHDDISEETLRLLKRATVAALVGMHETGEMKYETEVSRVRRSLEKVERRPRQLPRAPFNERAKPMTAQDIVEFFDRWNKENEKLPLMQSDFLFQLCRALQFPILDNLRSAEACLERMSNVLVSYETLDYPRISDFR